MTRLEQLRERLHKAEEKVEDLEGQVHDEQQRILEGVCAYPVVTEYWECPKSPVGYCVYNEDEDPAHDDCVYCHQPEERK